MRLLTPFIYLLATTIVGSDAKNPLVQCQHPKAQGKQLQDCPEGTLYVSQSDPQAEYDSIQAAILALPDDMCVLSSVYTAY